MDSNPNPLQDWILQKAYWEKSVWKACFEKDDLQESDIDEAYAYMLEDAGVNPAGTRTPIATIGNLGSANSQPLGKVEIRSISDFQNVNALPSTEKLTVGAQLTIVYGENGSGKSGISRLLGNACFFRGKRDLLPNVRTNSTGTASAMFTLEKEGGGSVPCPYKLGDSVLDLQRFYVFDTSSSVVHLDATNTVKFTPLKVAVFDRVKNVFLQLEQKLDTEKALHKKDNPASILFPNENDDIALFFRNMNADTSNALIDASTSFNDKDEQRLAEFEKQVLEKEKLDIPKKKEALKAEVGHLNALLSKLTTLTRNISVEKRDGLNTLITNTKTQKDIAERLSSKKFLHDKFKSIGNDKWTTLISVAKEIYEADTDELTTVDTCVLCQQLLSDKSKTLFNDYWEFLKGSAREELEAYQAKVKEALAWIDRNIIPELSDGDIATTILAKDSPDYLTLLKAEVGILKPLLEDWKAALEKLTPSTAMIPTVSLGTLSELIAAKIKEEQALSDPTTEIKRMRNEIAKLKSKRTASVANVQFKEYKAYLDWLKKVSTINFSTIKRGLTQKRIDSFNQEVATEYARLFSEECTALNGDFGLEIYTKGESQDSKKGLRLYFAHNHQPSKILSEGEQKVCSIADFLTEVRLDTNSAGIVFDDPVTSLDHERKDLIAKRLVQESKSRQVIILTHDIVFFLALQEYARKNAVQTEVQTVKKIGPVPGHISSDIPWIAMSMSKRVKFLKNELQKVSALHNKGDAEEYRKAVKGWCESLREAWERSIEESLFKGVVTRYLPSIQTQKLKDVVVTDEHKRLVHEGMTESSKWIHDQAAGLNAPPPVPATTQAWLDSLEQYITNLN